MPRSVFSLGLAFTLFVAFCDLGASVVSAQESTPPPGTPTAFAEAPPEICTPTEFSDWETVSEEPLGWDEWAVVPRDTTTGHPDRILYMVVVTLGPGKCLPYGSPANQKDGAVVMIIQQGEISYTAQRDSSAPAAEVLIGHPDGPGNHPGTHVDFGSEQHLDVQGEWVSQNDRVWFTIKNTGTEDAVIWKVVWADPPPPEGCGGDCK